MNPTAISWKQCAARHKIQNETRQAYDDDASPHGLKDWQVYAQGPAFLSKITQISHRGTRRPFYQLTPFSWGPRDVFMGATDEMMVDREFGENEGWERDVGDIPSLPWDEWIGVVHDAIRNGLTGAVERFERRKALEQGVAVEEVVFEELEDEDEVLGVPWADDPRVQEVARARREDGAGRERVAGLRKGSSGTCPALKKRESGWVI